MAELRKVVRQSGVILEDRPSNYDLHAVMVAQAEHSGRAARNLQKMLDAKYRRSVRALSKCRESQALARHWQEAMASGDIAGTLWALLTHPHVDSKLVRRAYEDVHMLSHLQGASNRADLKRLRALERELAELQETLRKTRHYQQQQIRKRDALIRRQARELEVAGKSQSPQPEASDAESIAGLGRENQSLAKRLDWTESRLAERDVQMARLQEERLGLQELLDESKQELRAMEQYVKRLLAAAEAHENRQDTALDLGGMRILYVGGQTRLAPHLRSLVEAHNGRFEHHDGGVEESRAGLQCALAGADLVFCPVDCISHDACQRAKQHCWQQNKRFIPLRSSGLSAFAAGLRYHSTSGIPPRGN
jgi:hypothetical protein